MNYWGFVGDMMNITIYHYPQHWARTCQYRVYVNNKYMAGCHGETHDEALNKYYDKLKDVPFPDAVKLPEPSNPPKEDESYLPLAIMITISGFAALYVGYRLWRYFL